jgi:hypothetical protein
MSLNKCSLCGHPGIHAVVFQRAGGGRFDEPDCARRIRVLMEPPGIPVRPGARDGAAGSSSSYR